ncbi:MAG: hypothetical protein H6625_03785 [Bdellovibrionaceae bacterium]|nr:hypothetical protein [Pseudobdellovibrionaceae bacterium]
MLLKKNDLFVLLLGRALQVIALFLNYKLLVNYLDKTQVGFYMWALSITLWFGLVLINPVGVFFNRQLHTWKENGKLRIAVVLFSIFTLNVSILCFIVFSFLSPSSNNNSNDIIAPLAISFYTFSTVTANTFIPALNILKCRVLFVILTVLSQFIGLGISVFLVVHYFYLASYWFLGIALAMGIFALISGAFLIRMSKKNKPKLKTPINIARSAQEILKFSGPLVITNICLWIITQSYRQTVEYFNGLEFLAIAGFGLTLAAQLSITIEYLVQQLQFPDFYEKIAKNNQVDRELNWNRYAENVLPIYLSFTIMVSICAPFIVPVFGKSEYNLAIYFLSVGIWAEFFRSSSNVFALIGQSEMNTSKTIFPYFIGSMITLFLLFFIGFTKSKTYYLPWVLIIGNLIVCTTLWWVFSKKFHICINIKNFVKKLTHVIGYLFVIPFYSFNTSEKISFMALLYVGCVFAFFQFKHFTIQEGYED